mmetsp:Transcript_20106/g.43809  ORF Transcript_20106/g.43809 Transcript_20106/m.43809 type:complete len:663 (-) Transcript_20106:526-2514(-)
MKLGQEPESESESEDPSSFTPSTEDDEDHSEDASQEEDFEDHGRLFEALEVLDHALANPARLYFKVGRNFRRFAHKRHGHRQLSLENARSMTKSLSVSLKLPKWIFEDPDQMFERFDFDGKGYLTKRETQQMFRIALRQRRAELGGEKHNVDVPESTMDTQGYTVVRELGRGGQGVMYLCTRDAKRKPTSPWTCYCEASEEKKEQRRDFCVKFYDKTNSNSCDLDELIAEYALMKNMNNKYVAKTYEVFQDRSFYYLVNKPYYGGDFTTLAKRAHAKSVPMTERWWRRLFRQCLEGLEYLHKCAIMHCDIKEPNIMVAKNDSFLAPVPVLIDFGLSAPFGRIEEANDISSGVGSPSGTPGYVPPETWETELWYPVGDVFSLGVVFFQLLTARVPSDHNDVEGVLQEGDSHDEFFRDAKSKPLPWDLFPKDWLQLRGLIEEMTCRERLKRPRPKKALAHEWFASEQDLALPPTTVRDMVYHSEGHELQDGVIVQLVVMNNLEQLRSLYEDGARLGGPFGNLANPQKAASLLKDAGLEDHLGQDFLKTCRTTTGHKYFMQTLQEAIDNKKAYSEQLIKDLFDELDTDKSGALSKKELRVLVHSEAFECPYEDVGEIMDAMDANHDGKVSFEEFLKVVVEDGRIARRSDIDFDNVTKTRPSCAVM